MGHHTFFCIDAHTCGNPVRVVTGGGPDLHGRTMAERREHFVREFDWIRTALMFEPRGHDLMSGSILYPPLREDCDLAVLFIETSGCLPMCGHGTMGTVTVAIEHGLVQPRTPGLLRLEVPAGRVDAHYSMTGGKVAAVRIVNVPSYLAAQNLAVECPELGRLTVDVAYGGNFYAIIDPQDTYPGLDHLSAADILRYSPVLRDRLNRAHEFVHATDPRIRGLSHIQWTGAPRHAEAHGRNAVFYGAQAIDRSPCGTGSSARLAQLHARGLLREGEEFVHESIIGSLFRCRIESTTTVGPHPAVIPSIEGWARVTGINVIVDDDDDPYAHGFQVL